LRGYVAVFSFGDEPSDFIHLLTRNDFATNSIPIPTGTKKMMKKHVIRIIFLQQRPLRQSVVSKHCQLCMLISVIL